MSLNLKQLALSLVSLLAILILSFILVNEAREKLHQAEALEKSVIVSTKIANLVHELQKERGRTAGYLGSGGKTFKEELQQQRELTNEKIAEIKEYLTKQYVSSFPPEDRELLSNLIHRLNTISEVRLKVDSGEISLKEALDFYTSLNNELIDSIGVLARHAKDADISRELLSYADLMYAKEKAGLERAILSVAFANRGFPEHELFIRFIDLMAQQKAFIKSFKLGAPNNVRDYYEKSVESSEASLEVANYERLALTSPFGGSLNVEPDVWFTTITKKIDLMHRVESYIAKDLLEKISRLKEEAKSRLLTVTVISFGALIVILAVTFLSLRVKPGRG